MSPARDFFFGGSAASSLSLLSIFFPAAFAACRLRNFKSDS